MESKGFPNYVNTQNYRNSIYLTKQTPTSQSCEAFDFCLSLRVLVMLNKCLSDSMDRLIDHLIDYFVCSSVYNIYTARQVETIAQKGRQNCISCFVNFYGPILLCNLSYHL